MKFFTAVVLLGIASSSYAFQCDSMFTGIVCGEYKKTVSSFKNAIKITDKAVEDAVADLIDDAAVLYKNLLPLKDLDVKNKVVVVGGHTIYIRANMTLEEVQVLMKQMLQWLNFLKLTGRLGTDDVNAVVQKIEEAITNAINRGSHAYAINSVDLDKIKEEIMKAIGTGHALLKVLISKALDRVQGHIETISQKIGAIMNVFGLGDKWINIKAKIDAIIARLKTKAGNDAIAKSEAAFNLAEISFLDTMNEMNKHTPIFKRGITDIWEKVKAAVKDLGDKISDATKKVVDQYKPKIVDALKNLKAVVIDGAKMIVIKINGQIVKILTDGSTDTSA